MRARSSVLLTCATLFVLGVAHAQEGPCNQEIMDLTKKMAASDIASGSTTLYAPLAAPTQLQLEAAQGKAAAAQDVERRSRARSDASQALEHAHSLDVQGKEAECLTEVMNAKQLAGL
jgi:hypothetical protein